MTIRAKDIAHMLNISTATVSNILNNKPGVGPETRALVIDKIKELNCEYLLKSPLPNVSPSGSIGFVVYKRFGDIIDESPFFQYALESINNSLQKHGFTIKFIYINKKTSLTEKKRLLNECDCLGLIIYAVEMYEDDLELFTHTPLPFVLLDNSFQNRDVDSVGINNIQGTCKAIRYLYQMGHRKIGYIKSKISINSFTERFREYLHQLSELNIPYNPEYVIETDYKEHSILEAVNAYLPRKDLPTAFFADNDLLGCHAIQAFKRHGIRIPDEVSVIGFDDRPICLLIEPQLTTIAVSQTLFGPTAVELLITKIRQPRKQSLKVDIGTSLTERGSVKNIS